MHNTRLSLGFISLLATACGGSSGSPQPGPSATVVGACSTNNPTLGMVCYDYGGGTPSSGAMSDCTTRMGSYSVSGCTSTGRTGGCRSTLGLNYTTTWFYGLSASDIRSACAMSGTTFQNP